MNPVLRRRLLSISLLLALPTLVAACCCGPVESVADKRLELQRARERWSANGVADYTFIVQRSCECDPATTRMVRVKVVGGQPVSHTYTDDDQPATSPVFGQIDTAEELFDIIGDALDQGAARVNASYDTQDGFPTGISIDYDAKAVDDEISYRMFGFTSP